MPITIGSNIAALRAERRLNEGSETLARVYERLSSGQRINHASDDAAGLAISATLKTDARVFAQANRNANDGLSLLSIAEGALTQLSSISTRIMELAEQSANGSYSNTQRLAIDGEAQALRSEFARIVSTTEFNGQSLLNNEQNQFQIQVGTSSDAGSRIEVKIPGEIGRYLGTGTFQSSVSLIGARASAITLGDLNRDGAIDLLYWNNSSPGTYRLGNGDGTFKAEMGSGSNGAGNRRGVLADLNSDGALDFAVADRANTSYLTVSLNTGSGTFATEVTYLVAASANITDVVAGDFNEDGVPDLAVDGAGTAVLVSLGNGNGTFNAFATYSGTTNQLTTGDVNNDDVLDIVSSGGRVFLGNGNGTFQVGDALANSAWRSPYLVDLNQDGNLDLVGADSSHAIGILLGNGNGSFQAQITYQTGTQTFNSTLLSVGDFNTDGNLDLVIAEPGDDTLRVLLNNGNGTFTAGTSYFPSAPNDRSVAVGDVNGDGVEDIVTGDYTGNSISIFLGNANADPGLAPFSLTTIAGARETLDTMRTVLDDLSQNLGVIGAAQSRLEIAIANNSVTITNSLAAASRITDDDVAEDSANLTRVNILQQAASAVLAQANQQPALALQLLRGG